MIGELSHDGLSLKAVRLPDWVWHPGMRLKDLGFSKAGCLVVKAGHDWMHWVLPSGNERTRRTTVTPSGARPVTLLPDLDHPGTAGWLEAMLGADLVTWDKRAEIMQLTATFSDDTELYASDLTKGRALVSVARQRGRWVRCALPR